jgi:hypothetical protein
MAIQSRLAEIAIRQVESSISLLQQSLDTIENADSDIFILRVRVKNHLLSGVEFKDVLIPHDLKGGILEILKTNYKVKILAYQTELKEFLDKLK